MQVIADLHIHSRFAGGCSKDITLAKLEHYARIKGVDVLGTGDFLHPGWQKEIRQVLVEDGSGMLRSTTGFPFILQTELSFMYSHEGKGRRVHLVVLAKNLDIVSQITDQMLKHGRIDYDGRPIFGIPCSQFVEEMMQIDKDIEIIPAHIWTPWFSLFGSKSGFDRIQDCFQDQTNHIHALETGLSSDPPMNWRLSQLDGFNLVSFSDLHSYWPWRLGREATLFDVKKENEDDAAITYKGIINALRTGDGLSGTIEVDPNYGKYHLDGHRVCKVCCTPAQSKQYKNICPTCRKPMTIGVQNRVDELADRELGFRKKTAKPFHSLLPLSDLVSAVTKKAVASKVVWQEYDKLVQHFTSEYHVLLHSTPEELESVTTPVIAGIILKNREGGLQITPGYDGGYGRIVMGDATNEQGSVLPENKLVKQQPSKIRVQRGLDEWAAKL
ncbi:DNA helicase UvrD [Candidatus Woesearchaeota archaeon]|nr:DNA helicase UvrD [Candidatus Woesearchaeota archaeon]